MTFALSGRIRGALGSIPQRLGLLLVFCLLAAGCARVSRSAADPAQARQALETTLAGWKKGDAPAALKDGSPSIIAQDLDWLSGLKLVAYEITGDGKAMEASLYMPVKLTLKLPNGKQVEKNVTYVVETSPYLSVFRALR